MSSWQESLPEDGVHKGLLWPCLSWWSHPHPIPSLAPLLALVYSSWCCWLLGPTQMAPKSESCCPTTTNSQVELSPE